LGRIIQARWLRADVFHVLQFFQQTQNATGKTPATASDLTTNRRQFENSHAIRVQLKCKSGWHSLVRAVGYNSPLSATRYNALLAILARFDKQIVESGRCCLKT
jgi:hypothetical protein